MDLLDSINKCVLFNTDSIFVVFYLFFLYVYHYNMQFLSFVLFIIVLVNNNSTISFIMVMLNLFLTSTQLAVITVHAVRSTGKDTGECRFTDSAGP